MNDDDDTDLEQRSRLGCIIGLAAMAASAAFMLWMLWLAWHAIRRQDVSDLLILAAILVALPAWHMVSQAFEREKREDLGFRVSQKWLETHRRSRL
jgi:ABC-type polysaccharide/polyol phosphate export permease